MLRRFFGEHRANHATDPTGVRTLARVLGERDLARFQLTFEDWALHLREP